MHKVVCVIGVICLLAGAVSAEEPAAVSSPMAVGFIGGFKMLDDGDWSPVENQAAIGARVDIGTLDWPCFIAADYLHSTDNGEVNGIGVTGETSEIFVGVRKYFPTSGFHPFIGGGVTFATAEASARLGNLSVSASENAVGGFVTGGMVTPVAEHFSTAIDLRYSWAETDIGTVSFNAGGFTVAGVLGFSF